MVYLAAQARIARIPEDGIRVYPIGELSDAVDAFLILQGQVEEDTSAMFDTDTIPDLR